MPRVLVVATSRRTRGGITSVIKAHETGTQWNKYHCHWIQTHRDCNLIVKIWYFVTAIVEYIVLLPFYDIVHFHFSEYVTAKRKRMLMSIAKFFGKKVISHFHAFSLDSTIRSEWRYLYEYLFSNSDIVLVLSEYWKNALIEELGMEERKVKILYNPCPHVESKSTKVKNTNSKDVEVQLEREKEKYSIPVMQEFIKKQFDEITRMNLYDLALSEEEFQRRRNIKHIGRKSFYLFNVGVRDEYYPVESIMRFCRLF